MLGHGQLITPDVGAAAMGAWAGYAFWRWLRAPGWGAALEAGVVLGLAELTKTTWILLFPLWPALWLLHRTGQGRRRRWLAQAGQMAAILLLGLFFLNAGYAFEGSFQRLGDYGFANDLLGGPKAGAGAAQNRLARAWLRDLPVPLPRAYVMGIGSSLWAYPHSLSYFNELVGGPKGGPAHLLDSNVDWGQDLLYLRRWLDAHPEARPLGLAFHGKYDARAVGIDSVAPPPGPPAAHLAQDQTGPLPGWYALSVTEIRGPHGYFGYFLRFEPVAMAGYSICIYHVTMEEANRVRRELGLVDLTGHGPRSSHYRRADRRRDGLARLPGVPRHS